MDVVSVFALILSVIALFLLGAGVIPIILMKCKFARDVLKEEEHKPLIKKNVIEKPQGAAKAALVYIFTNNAQLKHLMFHNGKTVIERIPSLSIKTKTSYDSLIFLIQFIQSKLGESLQTKYSKFTCKEEDLSAYYTDFIHNLKINKEMLDALFMVLLSSSKCIVCSAVSYEFSHPIGMELYESADFDTCFKTQFKKIEDSYCTKCKSVTSSLCTKLAYMWPAVLIINLNGCKYKECIDSCSYDHNPKYALHCVICETTYKCYIMYSKGEGIEITDTQDRLWMDNPDSKIAIYNKTDYTWITAPF